MKIFLVKICACAFGIKETGKEVKLQLPFAPEKGDFVNVPGYDAPCGIVARCFVPGEDVPVLYVIPRGEIIPKG